MPILTRKSLITLGGFASIFIAVAINGVLSANQQHTPAPKVAPQYPVVSVTEVAPISHRASITAYGEVKSRNQLTLTSQVSGQITYLSPKFLSGKTLEKGELLAKIEPIIYQQALADARANLADATLALAQEELNSTQAAQEWQQSGLANEQASDLVLRKPQLAAAKAKYAMASKAVAKAEYDLAQTRITAPFEALVVAKEIQIGSNVQAGSALGELYDIALFEVALPLSLQQWQLLPATGGSEKLTDIQIQLNDEGSEKQWTAQFDRFEQHIDSQSRQRALVAVVNNPIKQQTPLFPGTFVKATLSGSAVDRLWQLPASALIDSNTVWQVNENGVLDFLSVKVVFARGKHIYVQPLENKSRAQIVSRPLSSYLQDMKVDARVETKAEVSTEVSTKVNAEETI
ncbi:efflux RND transporter periplasmic adaptor subunit [Thalassomonas actiniarum]|uniref:Efflux RND transporter periplasmic adaptor subunit n=1 Tax=Thalassomonas actiniarum TaxID=485447 RepID=A0AAE9YQV3_9GAMM|nr:efflux RND transporter periplasmic adaptor subunit [Thalassomonas actiniarum]WDD98613.1 efflux RND transporter periplasmic adaptor subunit [Thalassomonas actiniarum]